MSQVAPTLVYLTGSGHSGSTLLDMALGGHPLISGLGEAHRIFLGANSSLPVHRCTCGNQVSECPFWKGVDEELRKRSPDSRGLRGLPTTDPRNLQVEPQSDRYLGHTADRPRLGRLLSLGAMLFGSRSLIDVLSIVSREVSIDRDAAVNSLKIYDAVRSSAGTPVIIDSTKNPGRLLALRTYAAARFKVIYLTRDGRAVCCSRMRREGCSMEEAAKIWRSEHRRIRLALHSAKPEGLLRVSYETLCASPEEILSRLCQFIGVAYDSSMLDFRSDQHNVGGNPMRFESTDRRIKLRERWRTQLDSSDLLTFERIAGPLNRRLGYEG